MFLWWLNAYSYTGWKVEDRPSSKIVFTFLKGKKIEEPLFNFDYDRIRDLTGTIIIAVYDRDQVLVSLRFSFVSVLEFSYVFPLLGGM